MKSRDKRVFIVHGWASSPLDCWFPWLTHELEKKGFRVIAPYMPDPKYPNIVEWVKTLEKVVGVPDDKTYFVGHSLGCHVMLKYLETLPEGTKVGGGVCVAGHIVRKDGSRVNTEKIKKNGIQIRGLFSDNDYYIDPGEVGQFREELGAEAKTLHEMGHFSRRENITQLPEALDMVLEIAKEG